MNINLEHLLEKASPSGKIYSTRQASVAFKSDPVGWLRQYPVSLTNILNTILEMDNNRRTVTLLHSTIAERSGCSIATVKVHLNTLEEAGLISRIGRYWRSSIFRVSDYFHNPRNRAKLVSLLKAFCWLPLFFLAICNGSWSKPYDMLQSKNQLLYESNIYKKYNSKFFIGNKDNSMSVKRTRDGTMELKNYSNMHKRYNQDSAKGWGSIVKQAHTASKKMYGDTNRPQCIGGSIKSEIMARRERDATHDQQMRMLVSETKDLAPVDYIKALLSTQGWMK